MDNDKTQTQKNVTDIREFLEGLHYPIGRGELIDAALNANLDPFIIEKMQQIPTDNYENEDDLSMALGEAEMF